MVNLAGIWNVNSVYNVNSKQISAKLSFEIGEKFSARIVNLNKYTGEILLKLLDGWKFPAQIDNCSNILENKLVRLQVEGFENDKLKLKVITGEEEEQNQKKDSINLFIRENSLNLKSDDYDIIEKMVKSQIPLTKDNISNVKTTLDFIDKIKENSKEEDIFIKNYLSGKNIESNSQEGSFIKNTLKSFFNELKNVSEKDLFVMMENNVELDEDNIKSFNKIFKQEGTIYNQIKYLGNILNNSELSHKNIQGTESIKVSNSHESGNEKDNNNVVNNRINTSEVDEKIGYVNSQKVDANSKHGITTENLNKLLDEIENINSKDKLQSENNNSLNIDDDITPKDVSKNELKVKLDNILNVFEKKEETPYQAYKNLTEKDINNVVDQIKNEINIKTEEMKDIIKTLLEQKNDDGDQFPKNIVSQLNNNINDFKVFNTVSNSYYYMDLPINLNDANYQCKLMIKDDRKRGKKIDATNVKIVTSISTENMGIVDAYLTVANTNMNIDIRCSEKWVNLMKQGHKMILESLSNIRYNVDVDFHEKKEEMNISTCREFFDDNDIGTLNIRV